MMVIADAERPLVVAGVMGSIDAEVDGATRDIFLESAVFAPAAIRRTSRRLALSTDSSYRFERGVDPRGAEFAARRAIDLILEVAGGELAGSPRICGAPPVVDREIEFTGDYMRRMLGFDVADRAIHDVLARLELDVEDVLIGEQAGFRVRVPSFRLDLERPIDLVEEFLRIYGTDKLPSVSVNSNALVGDDDPMALFSRRVGNMLAARGFSECVNYPLRSGPETALWSGRAQECFALANPLSSDQSHLRPSVLPGLLDNLLLNQSRGNDASRFFELGRTFREAEGRLWEYFSVGALIASERVAQWRKGAEPDFFEVSAIGLDLLRAGSVQVSAQSLGPVAGGGVWQAGQAASFSGNGCVLSCGLLDLAMTQKLGIRGTVYAVEVGFLPSALERVSGGIAFKYRPLSMQPPATRDIALLAPVGDSSARVSQALEGAAREALVGCDFALEGVRLFDLYEGKGLPAGMKSLAFTLTFRSESRTLTDVEVNRVFDLTRNLVSQSGYSVRS
jgi:phenylalanyl-tRNA synthetase beta chain